MKLLKSNPILSILNDYLIDSPDPSNITYIWNFGSLLGLCFVIQIISGVTLAMHYTPNIDLAFISIEHIMRDVNNGYIIRYLHANGAGFFFICVYIHIWKALYYGSYRKPRILLWVIGVLIFFIMIIIAFLGYVLPFGQMSLWGATVITNLFSAIPWIGTDLVNLIWGNFSVSNATINRFFSLHYLLPFILAALVILHFIGLHQNGSNNPLGISSNVDKIPFHPYFTYKDYVGIFIFLFIFSYFVFFIPNSLVEPDNYIPANPLVTPAAIVPEFYLLPFYAILRSIPNKLLGVIAMVLAILILLLVPFIDVSYIRSMQFRPILKFFYWLFIANFIILGWIGANHAEEPFILIGQISSFYYFFYFLFIIPFVSIIENILANIVTTDTPLLYIRLWICHVIPETIHPVIITIFHDNLSLFLIF